MYKISNPKHFYIENETAKSYDFATFLVYTTLFLSKNENISIENKKDIERWVIQTIDANSYEQLLVVNNDKLRISHIENKDLKELKYNQEYERLFRCEIKSNIVAKNVFTFELIYTFKESLFSNLKDVTITLKLTRTSEKTPIELSSINVEGLKEDKIESTSNKNKFSLDNIFQKRFDKVGNIVFNEDFLSFLASTKQLVGKHIDTTQHLNHILQIINNYKSVLHQQVFSEILDSEPESIFANIKGKDFVIGNERKIYCNNENKCFILYYISILDLFVFVEVTDSVDINDFIDF